MIEHGEKYGKDVVYFISYARLPANTPAANVHGLVGVGLFINYKTGEIVDISCTLLTEEAREFLKEMIIGHNINTDLDEMIREIKFRYNGFAQKGICIILKETYNKYSEWLQKNTKK